MNKMYTPTNLNELIKNQFLFRHWKTCTVDLARPSTRASEPSCTPANQDYHQILYVQSVSIRHRHHRHHHQGNHHHGSYSCLIFGRRALLVALWLKKTVLASNQPFLKAARLGWQGQIYLSSGKYSCLFLFFLPEKSGAARRKQGRRRWRRRWWWWEHIAIVSQVISKHHRLDISEPGNDLLATGFQRDN